MRSTRAIIETAHLYYHLDFELVYLKLPGEPEDLLLGSLDDDSECPDAYLGEWAWLRDEIADRERFAAGCYREAMTRDLDPRRW